MTEHLVKSTQPEEIGEFVASEFTKDENYVFLHDVPLLNVDQGEREELNEDKYLYVEDEDGRVCRMEYTRRYERYANMLRICQQLATFQDGDIDPLRSLQIMGRRSDDKTWRGNPQDQNIHFHTVEASYVDTSHIVSYWNAQTKGRPGDIVRILPVDRIIEKEAAHGPLPAVTEMQQPWTFSREGKVILPILDMENETVRYDPNQTNMLYMAESIKEFFREAKNDDTLVDTVELGPGDALFINNRKAFHSLELPVSSTRLTYRLLLYALKADMVAVEAEKSQIFQKAS